jgi:hypothetical protein
VVDEGYSRNGLPRMVAVLVQSANKTQLLFLDPVSQFDARTIEFFVKDSG